MYKIFAIVAIVCFATVSAGLIETHHVVHQPVLAKVGAVVHSAPSAVSHQSLTQVHGKTIVQPVLTPVVKTVVHAAPVVHTVPVVKTIAAPVVHTVHAAPVVHAVHAAPVVHSVPVLHSAPLVKHVVAAPVAYGIHH
ncbi:pupal cuticle protein C1B-like isoform X1 [Teleopsis dalmanni]|uniref:pupal cuticle protein C1B-like isoform X1 n=1 Tax=Teleopsis dalmanni TaxID=139649 RepID=UPI000D329C07|nr:pupal cuticle protein C1B-like isoform X1 [Teleopsis dalmanni]